METNKTLISDSNRSIYESRLQAEYIDHITGEALSFGNQFKKGGGQELKKKFWRTISSSRLCFDLYSWMAEEPEILSVRLEKKLPGIFSGGREVSPNMDAYFETEEDVFFIESKYTETVKNNQYLSHQLPQAYWKQTDVYKNSKGKDTFQPIIERYRNNNLVMDSFLEFIKCVSKEAAKEKEPSWFDAKQETCHLIGIVFYAIIHHPTKPIHFYNVAANYKEDAFANWFRDKSEEMIRALLKAHFVETQFDYKLFSTRDFFIQKGFLDKTAFQSHKTVRELISDPVLYDLSENPIL